MNYTEVNDICNNIMEQRDRILELVELAHDQEDKDTLRDVSRQLKTSILFLHDMTAWG